jgi:hypothetical protein
MTVTYEQAIEARDTLISFLTEERRCTGYDGEQTFNGKQQEYLLLIALKQYLS